MARLILVPQYPAKLRYQEWWFTELPRKYSQYFEEVLVLGSCSNVVQASQGYFSPTNQAISFEMQQIEEYLSVELRQDDILLLCDISFPGLFTDVLFHKCPARCFAICHATSKNKYDYFCKNRRQKQKVELGHSQLFDAVFVATEYHERKLRWNNTIVTGLPIPAKNPIQEQEFIKENLIVSVAREGIQKRTVRTEKQVEDYFGIGVRHPKANNWHEYHRFLAKSKILLITSKEETFGYQVVDAIQNNCIPIAPNAYSYPELLPREYLYDNSKELIKAIEKAHLNALSVPELLNIKECKQFFEKTAGVMGVRG